MGGEWKWVVNGQVEFSGAQPERRLPPDCLDATLVFAAICSETIMEAARVRKMFKRAQRFTAGRVQR
jgi:hypothetical protein